MGSSRERRVEFQLSDFEGEKFEIKDLISRITSPILADLGVPSTLSEKSLGSPVKEYEPKSPTSSTSTSGHEPPTTETKGSFDPAPFRAGLNAGLKELYLLRDKADNKIKTLIKETQTAEKTYQEKIAQLNVLSGQVFSKFRHLDKRIAQVSHTSVLIGHTLESVDRQKKLNETGQEIIQHFLNFHRGRGHLEEFEADVPKNPYAAAAVIQQLQDIADGLDVKGADETKELIREKATDIEKLLLERFKSAKKDGNMATMKKCAKTLSNFKNQLIVQTYSDDVLDTLQAELDSKLEINEISKKKRFIKTLELYKHTVLTIVSQESETIAQVFPLPAPVTVWKGILMSIMDHQVVSCVCGRHVRATPPLPGTNCLCTNPQCKKIFPFENKAAVPVDRIVHPIATVKRFLEQGLGNTTNDIDRSRSNSLTVPLSNSTHNIHHSASSSSSPSLSTSASTISPRKGSGTTLTQPPSPIREIVTNNSEWTPEEYLEILLVAHQGTQDLVESLKKKTK